MLQGETLAAWGVVPGASLTGAELLYRLQREKRALPDPEPAPEPEPEPEPIPEPEPELEREPEPEHEPEEAPEPADSAARAADFGLLVRPAEEVYESILHPPLSEAPEEGAKKPEGDWCSETEGLLARLRRK